MILTPSYGINYESARAVKKAFEFGTRFVIIGCDGPWIGQRCTINDLKGHTVTLKYDNLAKSVVVEV